MCEVIEHLTGMPPYFVLSGFFPTVGGIVEHALDLARGFPGRSVRLHMPPNWSSAGDADSDGVFCLVAVTNEEVWVQHRDTKEDLKVANGTAGVEWDGSGESLYIEYNWSDDRAVLKTRNSAKEVKLGLLLSPRLALALEDGFDSDGDGARARSNSRSVATPRMSCAASVSSGSNPLCARLGVPKRRLVRKQSVEGDPKKARTSAPGVGAADAAAPISTGAGVAPPALLDRAATGSGNEPLAAAAALEPAASEQRASDGEVAAAGGQEEIDDEDAGLEASLQNLVASAKKAT